MSYHCSSWAKAQRTGSPARKALLLVLADYANAEGIAYPSRETLAEESEQSIKSVDRGLAELVELGLIIKEPRREAGYQATNQYRLNANLPEQKKALRGNRLVPTTERQNDALSPEEDQGVNQGVNQGVKNPPPGRQTPPIQGVTGDAQTREQENKGNHARVRARDPEDDFRDWWEAYPQHGHGFSKDRAHAAWRALSPDDRKLALEQVKRISAKHMTRGKPQRPEYWLGDRVFATMAEERRPAVAASGWTPGYFVRPRTPQWEAWAKAMGKAPYDHRDADGRLHIGLRSAYDPQQGTEGRWVASEWPPAPAVVPAMAEGDKTAQHPLL